MNGRSDSETTPLPSPLVSNTDVEDRTPYIPRRKSSVENTDNANVQGSSAPVQTEQPQGLSRLGPGQQGFGQASHSLGQRHRLSRKGRLTANRSLNLYNTTFAQSDKVLPCHGRISSISSSGSGGHRRLLSRVISSLTNGGNRDSIPATAGLAEPLGDASGQMPRLSGSTAYDPSLRSTSLASTESSTTWVMRTKRSRMSSMDAHERPNPLRVPPRNLPGRDNHRHTSSEMHHQASYPPVAPPPPALTTAALCCISDLTTADPAKVSTVWVAIDVQCIVHYAEDPGSSLRSRALGPPHTDPGFLTNLSLDLAPAGGCNLLRLIGSHVRDILLPGETWTVVAQILVDPPVRKRPVKAFSLQNRTGSYALMDQLHRMLSPSGPSSQEIIHVALTFDQVLLPSNVHCRMDEKVFLAREASSWNPGSGPFRLRRRPSPQRTSQEHQQRDEVGSRLLHLLEQTVEGNETASSHPGRHETAEILQEFFIQQQSKVPTTSTKLQQRAIELLSKYEEGALLRPLSRLSVASPAKKGSTDKHDSSGGQRRNGMDLSRENAGLQDITNRGPCSPSLPRHNASTGSGAKKQAARDVRASTPPLPVPAPLFSPRKRPSVASKLNGSILCNVENRPPHISTGRGRAAVPASSSFSSASSPPLPPPSCARFYDDQVDEASQIWRGMRRESGVTTTGSSDSVDGAPDGEDSDGGDDLEVEPGGAGTRDGNRGGRGMGLVLGAPWL